MRTANLNFHHEYPGVSPEYPFRHEGHEERPGKHGLEFGDKYCDPWPYIELSTDFLRDLKGYSGLTPGYSRLKETLKATLGAEAVVVKFKVRCEAPILERVSLIGVASLTPALAENSCGCFLPDLTRFTTMQCGEARHRAF